MTDHKRIVNGEITAMNAQGLTVRDNGSERGYEFSRHNEGLGAQDLKVGQRIKAVIYKDLYLAEVTLVETAQEMPPAESDGDCDRMLRTSAAEVAAMILQTKKEPVHLEKLFSYAAWVEKALRNGFDPTIGELKAKGEEYRKARERGQESQPAQAA